MAKEIRIGIFAIIAIAIIIFGYNFLKGKSLLSSNNTFYIEYSNVNQLGRSAPVIINGLKVGTVKDVYLKENDYKTIVVEIEVDSEIKVPVNAVAEIISTGIMGGKAVQLVINEFCSGEDCAKHGDYLKGSLKGFLDSMVGTDKVEDYTDALQIGLSKILDSLSNQLSGDNVEAGKTVEDLKQTISNLSSMSNHLNRLLAQSQSSFVATMGNLESISGNVKNNNDKISTMLANASDFSGQLNDLNLKSTSDELEATISNLKTTLTSADQAIKELRPILDKIKDGEGTLGKLVHDPSLYDNLNRTATQVDLLMQDLRLNPKRYTRILSRKQVPYQVPEEDPATKK